MRTTDDHPPPRLRVAIDDVRVGTNASPSPADRPGGDATSIPLVDLIAQFRSIQPDVDAAVRRVLERQLFVDGPETTAFEHEFAQFCESEYAVGVSSGTTALELTLEALGVGPGDEVVTVSHTFIATIGAIVRTGATAVFVDVRADNWTMSPDALAAAVTPRTRAIVPVHLYGHPADVPALAAAAPGIPIVEDAAQAHGARYRGRPVGSDGAAACFSFYPAKNLGAYGDAGAIVTNDETLAARVRVLRDHGRNGHKYEHQLVGTNGRMAELQAAVLRAKLPHLPAWTDARRALAARYATHLDRTFERQQVSEWAEHARHLFVVLHPRRDALLEALRERRIGAALHYPVPVHRQEAMHGQPWRTSGSLATTERLAAECLSLPLYPELEPAAVDHISDLLRKLVGADTDQPLTRVNDADALRRHRSSSRYPSTTCTSG
jgi:dTDP-4-amino-4,6-dideoxygalactose transaminase